MGAKEPLAEGKRYRCGSCGNLTRFTRVRTLRLKEYLHQDLQGTATIDESEVLKEVIDEIACRWCSNGGEVEEIDAVTIEDTNAAP